jgi:3-deoxy-D-manno-octulosonic-acid transferase
MGKVKMRPDNNPAVLIHAVSLGEVNATQSLIKMLHTARPDVQLVLSTTTESGYAQAVKLYPHGSGVTVIRFPLDFTSAVYEVLKQLRPSVVVLMELELWPNFMKLCAEKRIPVVLVNGRLTRPSYMKYRLGGPIVKRMFSRLAATCVQDEIYAGRFKKLGAPDIQVTGTMKFDTAQITDRLSGTYELAREVGLRPSDERIWVCGSTGPGEEALILREFRQILSKGLANVRLVIVPRHPDRFDEVARLIEANKFAVVRRSAPRLRHPARRAGRHAWRAAQILLAGGCRLRRPKPCRSRPKAARQRHDRSGRHPKTGDRRAVYPQLRRGDEEIP